MGTIFVDNIKDNVGGKEINIGDGSLNVASDGSVGIGTTSPSDNLELTPSADEKGITLKTTSNIRPYINLESNRSSAGNNLAHINFKWNGTEVARIIGVAGADTTNKDDAHITFATASAGSPDERMRIDSSGNVGIGTTSISNGKLVLSGSNGTIGGVSGLATFAKGGTGGGAIEAGDNTAAIQVGSDGTHGFISTGNNDIRVLTNSGERMRINATGQVLIGTASSLYSSTQKDGLQIEGAGGGPFVIVCKNVDTGGGANQILFQDGSGDTCGEIASNATNNTTSYGTSSDYRLKENITDVTNAISTLKKLKPKTYNFISDPDNISEDGFLAHELGAVVPNAVTGEKDAMTSDNEIKPQQVDYGRLTPLLTAALQEAIARIDTLEFEVKTLKGQ